MYTLGYFIFRSQIFIGCMISRLRFFSIFKSWTVPVIVTQALCRNQCVRTETWLSIEQRSRRPIKSICSRLKAKEARIRGNYWNGQACSFLDPYSYHTRSEHKHWWVGTWEYHGVLLWTWHILTLSLHIILRGEPVCSYWQMLFN
jgi:hypothetical protein